MKRRYVPAAAALCAAMLVAGCGSSSNSGGGSGGSQSTGATKGAKTIDVNAMNGAKGNVTYCTGKDTSGGQKAALDIFNKENPDVHAKLFEFPESADEQRNQFIQRQRAKSAECDVFYSDVIWTAEFASQKWLYDMTPYIEKRSSEFIPSTIQTVTFDGKKWGVPQQTDAAFLYENTDKVSGTPATWQDVYNQAKSKGGIVFQGAPYEGLTCDFLELAFAAGGQVLSPDGKKSVINSPENLKALQFMVDGIKGGSAPKAVTTYMEEPSRTAFESGKYAFMRNWPYAYALGQKKGSKVKGKVKVVPLPSFEGAGKAGILGGHNLVVSVYSKNPGAALKLIDFLTKPEAQTLQASKYSLAPVLNDVYDAPEVKKAIPFAAEWRQAVTQAKARPVSPVYPLISEAIYKNVNAALSGSTSPQDALKAADSQINKALSTF